jgi:hypothetical protein
MYKATPGGKSILYFCTLFNYPNGHELEIHPKNLVKYQLISEGYYELTYTGADERIIQVSLTAF